MSEVSFYFDFSSPYGYLAAERMEDFVRVEDMYAYREFLERLSSVQGVGQTHTYVVMEEVKVRPGIVIP